MRVRIDGLLSFHTFKSLRKMAEEQVKFVVFIPSMGLHVTKLIFDDLALATQCCRIEWLRLGKMGKPYIVSLDTIKEHRPMKTHEYRDKAIYVDYSDLENCPNPFYNYGSSAALMRDVFGGWGCDRMKKSLTGTIHAEITCDPSRECYTECHWQETSCCKGQPRCQIEANDFGVRCLHCDRWFCEDHGSILTDTICHYCRINSHPPV